jgi:hypothetical protein
VLAWSDRGKLEEPHASRYLARDVNHSPHSCSVFVLRIIPVVENLAEHDKLLLVATVCGHFVSVASGSLWTSFF